jgi:hypothetical protein
LGGQSDTVEFTWEAKEGMHLIKAEVFAGTSIEYDDVLSEFVTIEESGKEMGDYTLILLIIIVILVIAVVLLAMGGKSKEPDRKGFVEEDHEDEEEEEEEE